MADILKFTKGMFKDTGQMDQVDGTYRDALNLIVDDKKLMVGNEYGNVLVAGLQVLVPLPNGSESTVAIEPVGQIALLDDNFIIFGVGTFLAEFVGQVSVSSIHKINVESRTVVTLYYTLSKSLIPGTAITTGDLKFDKDYPVTGELRESPVQETIIYFTDNKSTVATETNTGIEYIEDYNPPRVFNVTKQEKSLKATDNPSNLYGNNSRTEFLNLFMDSGIIPQVTGSKILKGGGVITGAYYLGLAYADDNRTETNVLTVSNPVYIVPADDDSFPREMISGAPNGTQTSKSIAWSVGNLNKEYKFIVPYVIQYSGNSKLVYKLEYVPITTFSAVIVYSGLEKVASSSVEEAAIDKVRYLTAKSITQLDNKMYAANLKSRPDLGFQRFANSIKIEPITELIETFDPRRFDIYNLNEGYAQLVYPDPTNGLAINGAYLGPTSGENYDTITGNWNPMGQLYSHGIFHTQFQAIDGVSETYSSLINSIQQRTSAGYRDPNLLFNNKGYRRGEVYAFYISFILKDGSESFAYHIPGRDKIADLEDDWTAFQALTGYGALGSAVKTDEITDTDPNARVYQYFDTSYMGSIPNSSNMGYWKNLNEKYPDTRDFEIWTVGPTGDPVYTFKFLGGSNVRHHKMPSNHNDNFSYVVKNTYFGAVPMEDPGYINTPDGNRVFNDKVRILGIRVENIKIPKFILKQVQGYKIYYAKRTQGNKTIIGQSGAHPASSYLASNVLNKAGNAGTGPFFNIWNMEGQLKYGGNIVANAKWVTTNNIPGYTQNYDSNAQNSYVGHPVFKFHDFNLLRKKHTLATATHIDVQYIAMMEMWRGGYKGALRSKIPDATGDDVYNQYYRTFRSGVGDDTYAWIHPDLGNMINFDAGSESSVYWDNPGPKILWGNVYVAAKYYNPGIRGIDVGGYWYDKDGQFRYLGDINRTKNFTYNQEAIFSSTQSILMIEQGGATYINGLSVLKTTAGNGFKGATYLYNAFGESGIAVSLVSGLPMLGGYSSNQWSYIGLGNLIWSLPMYNKGYGNNDPLEHSPGNLSLYSGWDINFNRGSAFNSGLSGEAELNQPDIWYYAENLWCSTMMQGHSSLRQPYLMNYSIVSTASTPIAVTINGERGLPGNANRMITGFPSPYLSSYTVVTGDFEGGNTTAIVMSFGTNAAGNWYYDFSVNFNAGSQDDVSVTTLWTNPFAGTPTPVTQSMGNDPKTRPNVYVVNLCSTKTDVFEPFDKQELVWTGYYKNLSYVDPENGIDVNSSENYYGGVSTVLQSTNSGVPAQFDVFGGDTYICRYGYRTTSNLYGLARFKRGVNRYMVYQNFSDYFDDYLFGDIPLDVSAGITPSTSLVNVLGIAADYDVLRWGGGSDNPLTATIEGAGNEFGGMRRASITTSVNWSVQGYEVFSTVYQFMVESDDNINYRHAGDPEKGVSELNSMYFDKYIGADVLYRSPLGDLTKMDNILYEDHYSAVQDIRVTVPYPKESVTSLAFPNRVIRSATQDGNFNDTYRYFLALQYKDFAVNKGPITNIFNLKALLYIHTERSLFRTKGKQNIELSDATQAYIGSGDLFAQEPDEFIQSTEGYNGLYNKMGALVTKDGYIFVSRKSRRIFLVKDEIIDLTNMGLHAWARENIPFALETYGWSPDGTGGADSIKYTTDAPTADFGFLVSYDPLFKRTIITKRDLVPTQYFIDQFKLGEIQFSLQKNSFYVTATSIRLPLEEGIYFEKGGWTISFSNNLSIWASRHSYIPPLYAYNSKYLYSFGKKQNDSLLYEHSDMTNPGRFYGLVYNFEIDCIFTAPMNTVGTGFKYTVDVFKKDNTSLPVEQQFDPGFTSFYAYNTTQISGEIDLVYLNTIRKTDNNWSVNAFRDMSKIAYNTGLANGQINVQGIPYNGTFAADSTAPMFNKEGIINPNYINSNKPWYEQRKFVDKFLGIRLIANNLSKNLINLYTVTASLRVSPR